MSGLVCLPPARPVLRWHGGKWKLAPWIISHFPPHRVYVEPFGGAASVLLRKPRAYAEVYNDLDGEVVTLFRVLRDPGLAAALEAQLRLTPFARTEFERSYEPSEDPVETARRLIVRAFMGFGSNAHATAAGGRAQTGFRANSNRSRTTSAHDWASYPVGLAAITERLRGVVIERRPAVEVIAAHDGEMTLHYLDPPYQLELRNPGNPYEHKHMYRHEMDRAGHEALLAQACALAGMVVLSGYPSPLYDDALSGWERFETDTYADGARRRVECLWINPACARALRRARLPLFAVGS